MRDLAGTRIGLCFLVSVCALSACSRPNADSAPVGAASVGSVQFALSTSALPPCKPAIDGEVWYVWSSSQFMVCKGSTSTWTATNLTGVSAAVNIVPLGPGAACPSGGATFQFGLDANRNGKLDAAEITATQNLCNGTTGPQGPTGTQGPAGPQGDTGKQGPQGVGLNSLLRVDDEAPGANCAAGGVVLLAGLDSNANGVLDPGEVTSFHYVCNPVQDGDSGTVDAGTFDGGTCVDTTALAIKQLSWGEGNSGQWKSFGFDLDGKASTASSTDLCQPNSGASPSIPYPDGDQGIDNSFGKNILPMLLAIDSTWVGDIQTALDSGAFTTLLNACLTPQGDAQSLDAKLFDGTPLGAAPRWDGTDSWPVKPELLTDPSDPSSSRFIFSGGSITGSIYDAGSGTFVMSLPMHVSGMTGELRLTIHSARVTMTLSPDRKSAVGGRLGGVLDTEELVAEVTKVGALVGLCGSATLNSLVTQVRQASDIMNDGTQNPMATCNGISIGVGFQMQQAQLGAVGPSVSGPTCP
jgi:hypothetical protein